MAPKMQLFTREAEFEKEEYVPPPWFSTGHGDVQKPRSVSAKQSGHRCWQKGCVAQMFSSKTEHNSKYVGWWRRGDGLSYSSSLFQEFQVIQPLEPTRNTYGLTSPFSLLLGPLPVRSFFFNNTGSGRSTEQLNLISSVRFLAYLWNYA